MRIEINQEDVGLVMKAVSKSMAEDLQTEIKRQIQTDTGYATGELVSSIQIQPAGTGYEVYSDKEYAPYLEYGTGLFATFGPKTRIIPTKAKALSWIDPRTGKRVFAKSVKGITPRFFFTKSLDLVQAKYRNDITRKIMRHIIGKAKIATAERFEATKLVIGREI